MKRRRALTVAAVAFYAAHAGASVVACAASRDSIPESRDVRVAAEANGESPAAQADGYLYVARRPLGLIGLADFRGVDVAIARAAAEKLADSLDTCATELGRTGKLTQGAARLVAQVGPDGDVQGVKLTTSPGAAVTANALLCLVSPLKLIAFPAGSADAGDRGLALEATWGVLSTK